jgi:uncharacterized protein YkwD
LQQELIHRSTAGLFSSKVSDVLFRHLLYLPVRPKEQSVPSPGNTEHPQPSDSHPTNRYPSPPTQTGTTTFEVPIRYKCHNSQNGKYIEVEINKIEQKIIIRDNLNHLSIQDDITEIISGESKTEYGPVLGINRICIE